MDPVSAAAGITGLITFGVSVGQGILTIIAAVKSADGEIETLHGDIEATCGILEQLKSLKTHYTVPGSKETYTTKKASLDEALGNCDKVFHTLDARVSKAKEQLRAKKDSFTGRIRPIWVRASWPLKKDDIQRERANLIHAKQTLNLCIITIALYPQLKSAIEAERAEAIATLIALERKKEAAEKKALLARLRELGEKHNPSVSDSESSSPGVRSSTATITTVEQNKKKVLATRSRDLDGRENSGLTESSKDSFVSEKGGGLRKDIGARLNATQRDLSQANMPPSQQNGGQVPSIEREIGNANQLQKDPVTIAGQDPGGNAANNSANSVHQAQHALSLFNLKNLRAWISMPEFETKDYNCRIVLARIPHSDTLSLLQKWGTELLSASSTPSVLEELQKLNRPQRRMVLSHVDSIEATLLYVSTWEVSRVQKTNGEAELISLLWITSSETEFFPDHSGDGLFHSGGLGNLFMPQGQRMNYNTHQGSNSLPPPPPLMHSSNFKNMPIPPPPGGRIAGKMPAWKKKDKKFPKKPRRGAKRYSFKPSDSDGYDDSAGSDDSSVPVRRRARTASSSPKLRVRGRRIKKYRSESSDLYDSDNYKHFSYRERSRERAERSRRRDIRQREDSDDEIPADESKRMVDDIVSQWIDVHEDEDEKNSHTEEDKESKSSEKDIGGTEKDEDNAERNDGAKREDVVEKVNDDVKEGVDTESKKSA